MDGLLLIDKPKTWTSFDAVNFIRKSVAAEVGKKPKNTKVGHTGTLDPLATGLLILVVGTYCRRSQEFSKLDKTYQVTAVLGQTSTTGDDEGEKTLVSDAKPSLKEVTLVCNGFIGEIDQIPPMYSAIKVNGQRAYDLARKGKEVTLQPRRITIHDLTITDYSYPKLQFTVSVSSGTYIRTLVEDIGALLRTGAYTSQLRRTKVGTFSIHEALSPQDAIADIAAHIITI